MTHLIKRAGVAAIVAFAAAYSTHGEQIEFTDSVTDITPHAQTVGLVLSGGGAKGIAEIGAIKALEENGIPIDCVAGTSMGAIVGSLYAAGYSPDEMMELITSEMFLNASTGTIPSEDNYLIFTQHQTPSLINLRFSSDGFKQSKLLPSSLISPMPMNFDFMSIFAGHTAQCGGDFNKLFVPLRTVASDMTHQRKVVFSHGQLDNAVRASMSFPIVFKPVEIDSALYYDGGIYDNFPVSVMREDFHPDFILGVDIHSTDTVKGFPDILQQMDILVIRPTNKYEVNPDEGMKLRIDVNRFGLLDFPKADQIYQAGYDKTLEMMDSIKSRVISRRDPKAVASRRAAYNSHRRPMMFEDVEVVGGTPSQNAYIRYFFAEGNDGQFGLDRATEAYHKAISTGMLKDLDPMAVYNPETGRFKLRLKAEVKDNIDLGLGGYITSSVNSMLFLSLGYKSFDFRTIDASVSGWLGQSYMAGELNARAILRRKQTSSFGLQAAIWRQKYYESDKLFYEDDSPAFIKHVEGFARLKFSVATGRRSMFDVGLAYGRQVDRFYNNDETIIDEATEKNKTAQNLGQLMASWDSNTLDDNQLPTAGRRIAVMAQGVIGNYDYVPGARKARADGQDVSATQHWAQVELLYRDYHKLSSHWTLGYESNILASTRKLYGDYNAAIVNAYAYNPTPSSYTLFNRNLRANSYAALSFVPVYKMNDRFELRAMLNGFLPIRPIVQEPDGSAGYGDWFSKPAFIGELAATLKLPFANLSVYGTYQTSPGDRWGVGISFGYFILAPKMLRL